MNVVSWPFCVSPGVVVSSCDQLVCASTVVHNDVVRLCTCSSKPCWGPSVLWYTTIVSTSITSDHESVTLPLGYTYRLVDEPHSVSPLISAEQSRDPPPHVAIWRAARRTDLLHSEPVPGGLALKADRLGEHRHRKSEPRVVAVLRQPGFILRPARLREHCRPHRRPRTLHLQLKAIARRH
eukprot:scaffold36306_cov62-Phaeocystis_antarctica.AAC.5